MARSLATSITSFYLTARSRYSPTQQLPFFLCITKQENDFTINHPKIYIQLEESLKTNAFFCQKKFQFAIGCFRYLDRLADSLQQKLKVSEKLVASSKVMAEKRLAASKEQIDLEPKLEVIRSKTKELQGQVCVLLHNFSLLAFPNIPFEKPLIAQNEWTSLIIHDLRSGKFKCTSALNDPLIREEWAIFGPPALIKSLARLR